MTMYVITHKEFHYNLPKGYQPVLVGANFNKNPLHYISDNTGENISNKNKSFCELTGLYWIWKNTNDSQVGISHYRRYFSKYDSRKKLDLAVLLTGSVKPIPPKDLDQMLADTEWIVAQPESGGKGTLGETFAHYHHKKDLDITRQVIQEKSPKLLTGFDKVMQQERGSFYNMFYTSREQLDKYCKWLFSILFEVEKRVDISQYDSYQQRLFGFLGERLLNVWLIGNNKKVSYLAEYQTDKMSRTYVWNLLINKIKNGN